MIIKNGGVVLCIKTNLLADNLEASIRIPELKCGNLLFYHPIIGYKLLSFLITPFPLCHSEEESIERIRVKALIRTSDQKEKWWTSCWKSRRSLKTSPTFSHMAVAMMKTSVTTSRYPHKRIYNFHSFYCIWMSVRFLDEYWCWFYCKNTNTVGFICSLGFF